MNIKKYLFVLICVILASMEMSAQVDRIELGYQTTKRGIVWYRPGLPTHAPVWQFSRDTNAVLWVDTVTALRYDYDYSDDRWRTKGTASGAVPPRPEQTSGSALVDNRTAFWIRDTFNLLHKYDSTANAWTPIGDWFFMADPPTDITASGSNGAAVYTRSLWQDSDDNTVRFWDGDSWEPFGGSADGSETIVTGTNGVTVTGTGTSGTPYVVGMPAATNTQTLRHNGTAWVANSLLTNDGSNLGVNSAPSSAALIRIKQAGNTDGIELERDTDTRKLQIYQDGNATIQSTAGNLDIKATSGTLTLFGPGGGGFVNQADIRAQSNITSVFGNSALLRLSATYAPTTSGGDFGFFKFLPTINQTGTSNQDIFMMDFNPTLTSVLGTLYGVRYNPSIGRAFWQPNGAGTVINHFAGNTGIGSGSTAPAQTLHVQGTARITGSDGTPTSVVGRDGDGDISALGLSGMSVVSGTLTATDGSTTNELQAFDNTSDATSHTVTLSNSGGSFKLIEGTGIELATAGTALDGEITISATSAGPDSNGIYTASNTVPTNITATLTDRIRWLSATDDAGGWAPVEIESLAGNEPDFLKFKNTPTSDSMVVGYGDAEWVLNATAPLAMYVDKHLYLQTDSMFLTGVPNALSADTSVLMWGPAGVIRKKPLSEFGSGGITGTGTANRVTYWTGGSTVAADDDFAFDGTNVGIGTTTLTGRLNVSGVTGIGAFALNAYAASTSGSVTYSQFSNTVTNGSTVISLNEVATLTGISAGLRRFGSTHSTRPLELNLTTFVSNAPVTIGTNDGVRFTVAANGMVHAHNNLAAGFTSTTGITSTLQSAGSFAAARLETVGAPTFDATKHTVIYTASTNVTWTLPSAASCSCDGRVYILHHAGTAGTVTLSQTITKGNAGNFNTLTAGQWAYITYGASTIRGYKLTSL
jgi:hypothetical protein